MNFTTMAKTMQEFFGKTAKATAAKTKFVQRKSKVDGKLFLKTVVFGLQEDPEASWEKLATVAKKINPKVSITAQGLHARMGESALAYLEEMTQKSLELFKNEHPLEMKTFERFSQVNLIDSSHITLPDSMKEEFRSQGGVTGAAGMKVQLMYEFLTGHYRTIELKQGVDPDQNYAKEMVADIEVGSLNVQDLGYFSLAYLKAVAEKSAYYISRWQWQTAAYESVAGASGQRIDLGELLRYAKKVPFEIDAVIGREKNKSKQVGCRIIFIPLSEAAAQAQRRNAHRQARKKGRTLWQNELALMDWAIFITNAPRDLLSTEEVGLIYRLRWQVELLFKLWKSHYLIDQIREEKSLTVKCRFYAKMIGLILFHFLCAPLRWVTWTKQERELSWPKSLQLIKAEAVHLAKKVWSVKHLGSALRSTAQLVCRYGLKTRRVGNQSTFELLQRAGAGVRVSRLLETPAEYLRKWRGNLAGCASSKLFKSVPVTAFSGSLA